MRNRSLVEGIRTFKSGMLHAWTGGISVPMDEIFIPARLTRRHIDNSGGIANPWLQKRARSTALKWRVHVCGDRDGRIAHASVVKVDPLQAQRVEAQRGLQVTARYCERTRNGAFLFRHGICNAEGRQLLEYLSEVYFHPQPRLPEFPALRIASHEAATRPSHVESEALQPLAISVVA